MRVHTPELSSKGSSAALLKLSNSASVVSRTAFVDFAMQCPTPKPAEGLGEHDTNQGSNWSLGRDGASGSVTLWIAACGHGAALPRGARNNFTSVTGGALALQRRASSYHTWPVGVATAMVNPGVSETRDVPQGEGGAMDAASAVTSWHRLGSSAGPSGMHGYREVTI